jgi:hypothetical protein
MNEKKTGIFQVAQNPGGAQDWYRVRNRSLEHANESEKETGLCRYVRYVDTQMIR